jgi:hypothetical protein
MNKAKVDQIRAFAESLEDPVFKRSVCAIADAMELAVQFKRLDMAFLQMRGTNNVPKFALLDYDAFKGGATACTLSTQGYVTTPGGPLRFGELFARGDFFGEVQANPKVVVPESVDAIVQDCREKFDEVLVAWEADWQPRAGDPIVIGRLGTYWFVITSWDMTKLESFVASTFGAQ